MLKLAIATGVSLATLSAISKPAKAVSPSPLVDNFYAESSLYQVPPDPTKNTILKITTPFNPYFGLQSVLLVTVDGGDGTNNQYGEVALGQGALSKWAPGLWLGDTAIGFQALMNDVGSGKGASNTAVGYQAGLSIIDGQSNTLMGVFAMTQLTHGGYNAAFGELSMFWQTGSYNTALGRAAAYGQPSAAGSYNTAIGEECLHLTRGSRNTSFGAQTLFVNLDGNDNIAIGFRAGYYDTASGHLWLWNQTTGSLAGDIASALMYGVMDSNPANQTLRINANVTSRGLSLLTLTGEQLDVMQTIKELQAEIIHLKNELSQVKQQVSNLGA